MEDAPDREEALNQLDLDEMDELEVRVLSTAALPEST